MFEPGLRYLLADGTATDRITEADALRLNMEEKPIWFLGKEILAPLDKWIENRGACPVPGDILVDVRYRKQHPSLFASGLPAKEYSWRLQEPTAYGDIISYSIPSYQFDAAVGADQKQLSAYGEAEMAANLRAALKREEAKDARIVALEASNDRLRAWGEKAHQKAILLQDRAVLLQDRVNELEAELYRMRFAERQCLREAKDKPTEGVTVIVNDLPPFGKIPETKGANFPPSHRYRHLP